MSNTPAINTQEDQNRDPQENQVKLLLGLGFILVSPITVITAALVYFLFSYIKIKRSVIAVFSLPIFIAPLFFIGEAWENFIDSWFTTFPTMLGSDEKAPLIIEMLGQQFWIAVPSGVLVGLGFASWRWFTRARWQDWQFRKTPWELIAIKRTIAKIKNDEDTPKNGMTLGIDKDSTERVVQTYEEAAGQTFLVGGSGAGKTRTALTRVRDQIKNGDGVCIVDLKGDPEVANIVKIYCERYGRKFQHFTLQDISHPYLGPSELGPAHYDPLAQGDHTRRADMVLDLRDWTNADYFKKLTQSYLQLLFTVHINNPPKEGISALEDAIRLMSPKYLQERARPLAGRPEFASRVASIDALNDEKLSTSVRDNLQTNRSQLEIFLQGVAGPWLTHDRGGNNISLLEAALNGDVVVFSLDSQAYPTLAGDIANLIIQDLKTVSSELLKMQNKLPFHIFIDEFSAIGSENIVGLINKARASNMFVTIATQALGDLMVKNPALQDQILGIISSFIIHRANKEDDAKVYAGLTGTTMRSVVSQKVDYSQSIFGGLGKGSGSGGGTVQEVEQWKIMPNKIQALGVGEMYYINTSTKKIKNVQCIIEDLADPKKGGTNAFAPSSDTSTQEKTLEEPVDAPSLLELMGKDPSMQKNYGVNQELTENPALLTPKTKKESPNMLFNRKKEDKNVSGSPANADRTTKQNFDEVRDMEKVPLNYDLLRTFFNDPNVVDEQEREDIRDGVASDDVLPPQRATPAPSPRQQGLPSAPVRPTRAAPVTPSGGSPFAPRTTGRTVPTRPQLPNSSPQSNKPTPPSKSEFDF